MCFTYRRFYSHRTIRSYCYTLHFQIIVLDWINILMNLSLATLCNRLLRRVINKILSLSWYPSSVDQFSWGWSKIFFFHKNFFEKKFQNGRLKKKRVKKKRVFSISLMFCCTILSTFIWLHLIFSIKTSI